MSTQPAPIYSDDFHIDGIIQINDEEFQKISSLVYSKFGINLTEKKKALVRGRLNKLIKGLGYTSFDQYYNAVMEDRTGGQLLSLIDKISTNHSYFFREHDHFTFLMETALPEIVQKTGTVNGEDLRIWCAGCAAGEEAYTLAIVIREFFGPQIYRRKPIILATDISLSALNQAAEGVYVAERIKTVPPEYEKKYIQPVGNEKYGVSDELKKLILFKRLNFMRESFPFKGKFHIIFCRNVMIYFDNETKLDLVARFHRYMYDDGFLFIGHSESLGRGSGLFRYVQPALYRKI